VEFAKTESLRVYAIACRLGFEDETQIASPHMTSIHPAGLTGSPNESKSIPAMEYHRLILVLPSTTPQCHPSSRGRIFSGLGAVIEEATQ